jgi:hypothetical protein
MTNDNSGKSGMIHALSINITIPFGTPQAGVLDGGQQQAACIRSSAAHSLFLSAYSDPADNRCFSKELMFHRIHFINVDSPAAPVKRNEDGEADRRFRCSNSNGK